MLAKSLAIAYRVVAMDVEAIKAEMSVLGVSMKELAAEATVNYSMLSQIINGKRPLTNSMEERLTRAIERMQNKGIAFELPPEAEKRLKELAAANGLSPSEAAQKPLERVLNLGDL